MASSALTFEEIHEFFSKNGGSVSNRDVVKHFKPYLTHPTSRDDARLKFKKYINKLANSCNEGDQKILTLKPRYMLNADDTMSTTSSQGGASPKYDPRNAIGIPTTPVSPITNSPGRAPPPYRPPPPAPSSPAASFESSSLSSSNLSLNDPPTTPQAPPRKRSSSTDKPRSEHTNSLVDLNMIEEKENERPDNGDKQTVSVKERTQKFNRLASVDDELSSPKQSQNKAKKKQKGVDEDDGASVTSLEPKQCAAWYVAAAKGDYQELAKLASREVRLVKLKDPYTTVLHWGSKHGNVEIIKLFAGTYKADVNAKTNGGYVPLHLAAQFGHEDAFNLLVDVYKADISIRDFSGRKPEQYKTSHIQARQKVANKSKGRKNKHGDKDMGFLRIGSLNVRVKKTTEAFSSFLGVGGGSMSSIEPISEKVHKGWGSADNVGQDSIMAAPKSQAAKRKSKRPLEQTGGGGGTHSNPGTPNQPQKFLQRHSLQDSDSDGAAGFDSHWQN